MLHMCIYELGIFGKRFLYTCQPNLQPTFIIIDMIRLHLANGNDVF